MHRPNLASCNLFADKGSYIRFVRKCSRVKCNKVKPNKMMCAYIIM